MIVTLSATIPFGDSVAIETINPCSTMTRKGIHLRQDLDWSLFSVFGCGRR